MHTRTRNAYEIGVILLVHEGVPKHWAGVGADAGLRVRAARGGFGTGECSLHGLHSMVSKGLAKTKANSGLGTPRVVSDKQCTERQLNGGRSERGCT